MTADGSPVLSPRHRSSMRLRPKRVKTDRAICQAGALLALMALGRDIGDIAAKENAGLDSSTHKTFSRHRSLTGKRSREFSPSHRLSWINSPSSDDSTFSSYDKQFSSPEQSPSEKSFNRIPPRRPLSTPVLLKATFYHDSSPPRTFEDPSSPTFNDTETTSTEVENSSEAPLIDLNVFERRDRRSRSLDSKELHKISLDALNGSNLTLTDSTITGSDPFLNTVRHRLSSSSTEAGLENLKLPPPPPSPRLNSPNRDVFNHEADPVRRRPRPRNLNLTPSSEGSGPVSPVLASPSSEPKKELTLLDVEVEGQTRDTTKPLIQPETVKKPLSIKELEREFVDSLACDSNTTAI